MIEVKNLGKKYSIRHHRGGYVALRDVLANIAKSPFRFAKTKVKEITGVDTREDFWALRDINFTVEQGEVIGIIGKNGAGKSTMLKILTGITPPTTGEARMHGHVSSLLEVGTGFHPELTGRENIFLNGAILGMSRRDIVKNFDAIVAFAGIDQFLDTPVKYYSSGMHVRLAFSVAAHLKPDILLVDEVLAVGDAEFQKKCLGKMEEVTKQDGRTILFVSHNMSAILNLCTKTILLDKGKIVEIGETPKVIDRYLGNAHMNAAIDFPQDPSKDIQISRISILNETGEPSARIPISEKSTIEVEFEARTSVEGALLSLLIYANGEMLLWSSESDKNASLTDYAPGKYKTTIALPAFLLNVGTYFFDIRLHKPWVVLLDERANLPLEILDVNNPKSQIMRGHHPGRLAAVLDYATTRTS
ncbi:MAG: ABC transporter ATP-binding protein [Candidatus Sungbacteria bacterium]|nr:ABC transporter ATP-binding protein [Candidatus Sungbacteria bacterium]